MPLTPIAVPATPPRNYLRLIVGAAVAVGVVFVIATTRPAPAAAPTGPTDASVTAAMQAAIARDLPSWRGFIAEVGGKPDVAANGPILYVATTLSQTQVDGIDDLCVAVGVWARAAAPTLSKIIVIRSQRELASCRVR